MSIVLASICRSSASNAYGSGGTSYAMGIPLACVCDLDYEISLAALGFRPGSLVAHGRGTALDLFRIAEVPARLWLETAVELVDPRHPRRDVQVDHLPIGETVEVLDERAQAVAVGGDEDARLAQQVGHDGVVPVREHPLDDVFQALRAGEQLVGQPGVSRIMGGMPLVGALQGGRPHVVAAPPDLHLFLPILLRGLLLVEPLEGAVVAFVEAPAATHGDPRALHLGEGQVGRLDRAHEQRRVDHGACEAGRLHQAPRLFRLYSPELAERDAMPSREQLLE